MSPERDAPLPGRRILLALDYGRDVDLLETATRLASNLEATLDAIFFEDPDLLRIAQLPFASEIGIGSATARRLELTRLERELKNRAEEIQRLLGQRTGAVQWSFTVSRAPLPLTGAGAAPPADLYLLPRRSRLAPAAKLRRGSVVVVVDGSPESLRALEAGVTLADGSPLVVLVPTAAPGIAEQTVMPLLERHGLSALLVPLANNDADAVATAARQQRAELLLLGHSGPYREPATLSYLLERTGIPLVVAT